jgi:hypothetical protein
VPHGGHSGGYIKDVMFHLVTRGPIHEAWDDEEPRAIHEKAILRQDLARSHNPQASFID